MPSSPSESTLGVDVQFLMKQVRSKARAGNREQDQLVRIARKNIPASLPAVLARLRASTTALEEAVSRLGDIPPGPPTLRAQVGALGVRTVQRGLFWFLPALRSTQQNLVGTLREHIAASDELLKSLTQTNIEVELLRRRVEALEPAAASSFPGASSSSSLSAAQQAVS